MWLFILGAGFCFWVQVDCLGSVLVDSEMGVDKGPAMGYLCLGLPRADLFPLLTSFPLRAHHHPVSMGGNPELG